MHIPLALDLSLAAVPADQHRRWRGWQLGMLSQTAQGFTEPGSTGKLTPTSPVVCVGGVCVYVHVHTHKHAYFGLPPLWLGWEVFPSTCSLHTSRLCTVRDVTLCCCPPPPSPGYAATPKSWLCQRECVCVLLGPLQPSRSPLHFLSLSPALAAYLHWALPWSRNSPSHFPTFLTHQSLLYCLVCHCQSIRV